MRFKNWFSVTQENEDSIRSLIDGQGLVLFFKKDDEYFGTGEDGRIVFARIKNPDDETPEGWEDEASFVACNLNKMAQGENSQHVFNRDAIKKLKVVDADEVIDKLSKVKLKNDSKNNGLKIIHFQTFSHQDRDEAPNFSRTDEE